MDDLFGSISAHSHFTYDDKENPLVQAENASEMVIRQADRLMRDEQIGKAELEFSRQPWWVQAAEIGDYAADGSDLQPYEPEQREDKE